MRHYLKSIIITVIAFYIALTLIPTINLGFDPKNILIVVGGFLIANLIIRPLFSIILLPINILTFGSIALVLNIALLIAYMKFLPGFTISPYNFPGAVIQGFIIPPTFLNQYMVIAAFSIIITLIQKVLQFIFE